MSVFVFALLTVAGGAGAAARFALDVFVRSRVPIAYPLGTTIINVSGSLLLGLVVGLAMTNGVSREVEQIVGGGFLGGYTTFSTASFETVRLIQSRRVVLAIINGVGMLVVSVIAAGSGLWVGLTR